MHEPAIKACVSTASVDTRSGTIALTVKDCFRAVSRSRVVGTGRVSLPMMVRAMQLEAGSDTDDSATRMGRAVRLHPVRGNVLRVVVLGAPGLLRDAVVALLNARNMKASSMNASSLRHAAFDVLVLIEPRRRDWELLEVVSPVGVVVVDDVDPVHATLAGADAVVGFGEPAHRIVAAVETVAAGGAVLDARVARAVVDAARAAITPALVAPIPLSNREATALRAVARGDSTKQTARSLGISVKTVEELQRRAYRKLGARNGAHAVALLAGAPKRRAEPVADEHVMASG